MTPIKQLTAILSEKYISEDGDEYKVELTPGLTDQQIDDLATALPGGLIPAEIRELLRFASGFAFYGLDAVTFDEVGQFGFQELFPCAVQLAGDGFGNFWILDVESNGHWGNVFYVCHDPAVIVKHSRNLAEFISHMDEFGKKGKQSNLDIIHEVTVIDIWTSDDGFMDKATALAGADEKLQSFALSLPDNFVIADLRDKPNGSGFAWGKFGPDINNARRHDSALIWGIEKVEKKSFLSRLFGD